MEEACGSRGSPRSVVDVHGVSVVFAKGLCILVLERHGIGISNEMTNGRGRRWPGELEKISVPDEEASSRDLRKRARSTLTWRASKKGQ